MPHRAKRLATFLIVVVADLSSRSSFAQNAPSEEASPPPDAPPTRAPYSLPFQLRPVTAGTGVRSDSSFAGYQNALAKSGFAWVSELTGSYRIPGTGPGPGTGLAPLVKLTAVNDSPPGALTGGFAFVNPLVGASYAVVLGSGLRASAFLGLTIPVGMGGGDKPDAGALDARTVGPVVRAGMDNALFAVDDLTVIPGIDLAYVAGGFTAQIEATLFQLERVRGAAAQHEASKTNFTSGLHVGYFVVDALSIGAELHYQRWFNAPIAVDQHKPGTSGGSALPQRGPALALPAGEGRLVSPRRRVYARLRSPHDQPGERQRRSARPAVGLLMLTSGSGQRESEDRTCALCS